MSFHRTGRWLVAYLVLAVATPAAAALQCGSNGTVALDQRQRAAIEPVFDVETEQPAWLEVEESGRALQVSGGTPALRIAAPPRLARHGIRLAAGSTRITVRDSADPTAAVRFYARLFCRDVAAMRSAGMLAFTEVVAALDGGQVNEAVLPPLLARLQTLQHQNDTEWAAQAEHFVAQALLLAGHSAEAMTAFAQAERTWLARGDTGRAMAARAAWSEEAYALARYDEALHAADTLPAERSGVIGYYAARVFNCRCLALKYRGLRDQAADCYAELVDRLVNLAEPLELANALHNLGGMQRDLGRLDEADATVKSADSLMARSEIAAMVPVDVASVRGRLNLLRADLSLRRGSTAAAIAEFDRALAEFEIAKSPRWRASTLIQLAALYGRLGAFADAYTVWSQGFALYRPNEAPNRIATALMVLAQIQRDEGNPLRAAWLADLADGGFGRLGTPVEQNLARNVRIRALIDAGEVKAAQAELRIAIAAPQQDESALQLAQAATALAQGNSSRALANLAQISATSSFAAHLDLYTLRAKSLRANGDKLAAQATLDEARALLDTAIGNTQNALLRLLLQRRLEPLRRMAVDWLGQDREIDGGADEAAAWLPYLQQPGGAVPAAPDPRRQAFDQALARELLLGQSTAPTLSSVALASALSNADVPTMQNRGVGVALPQLRAALQQGQVLFAVLEGESSAYALWVTRQQAQLLPIAPPSQLRVLATDLASSLRTPDAPLAEIERRAQRLAAALWPRLPELPQNGHLLVAASNLTDGIAWSLLPLPGRGNLIDSFDVSLVHLDPHRVPATLKAMVTLRVAVAAQLDESGSSLAPLAGASNETKMIADALAHQRIEALQATQGSLKPALLAALAESGSWVHVAAHGLTRPGYVAHSGIWLDRSGDSELPEFLSILDLFDRGVGADLVVLNACDLASGGSQAPGALAFADTLVRLGASHVVAGLNAVSDGAAVLWVPAFYRRLGDSGASPAAALRESQQVLRRSRAYRHPFYWSSLIHVAALPLNAATASD